ncbi:hypothetical protein ADUPG1_014206 [Aduncisulcus paluster]|uniref:Uncharacterized protein n=1 Tax=Aduncisulcus paluster TaxID=2918883 RepID=A0ABQ5KB62_9EUKA|nr:hypothetical protein ADUPG1_014206 [Aduncisulcus paluster]
MLVSQSEIDGSSSDDSAERGEFTSDKGECGYKQKKKGIRHQVVQQELVDHCVYLTVELVKRVIKQQICDCGQCGQRAGFGGTELGSFGKKKCVVGSIHKSSKRKVSSKRQREELLETLHSRLKQVAKHTNGAITIVELNETCYENGIGDAEREKYIDWLKEYTFITKVGDKYRVLK